MNCDDMRKTYVWLDIFSIAQFHNGCKLRAVSSLYVYETAADGFIIIALDFAYVNTCAITYYNGQNNIAKWIVKTW